jgi:hypothetical protein
MEDALKLKMEKKINGNCAQWMAVAQVSGKIKLILY